MDLGIKGKTALVLGASQGMGAGIARVLAENGANVIVGARRADKLADLVSELEGHGVKAEAYPIDLSDKASVDQLCAMITDDWQIDMLLNNAGGPPPSPSTGVADEVWAASIQALLMSTIRITEAALHGMKERKWGRVLTIASSGVKQPIDNLGVSNTVRGAVAGFTKSLSNEVAQHGVTVNMILPGRIETERLINMDINNSKRKEISLEDQKAQNQGSIPAKRYGTVEEFAGVAAFLMSERASYVTGSLIRVDGGLINSV
ncbi:MAG: SDR family oxidoreductase [Rhodospirillaceae bacterium]